MARKVNTANAEVVRRDTIDLIASAEAHKLRYEEGSGERRAWQRYIDALRAEALAEAELDIVWQQVKDKDIIPDKLNAQYMRLLNAHSRAVNKSLGSYMTFDHIVKHTFTVPDKDAVTIILDALKANQEAMPDEAMQLTGPARHHAFSHIAAELVEDFKSERVKVRETDEFEAPMCADCQEEIAA